MFGGKPLVAVAPLLAAALLILCGATEGMALYAAGILPQRSFRSQMTFASMIIMKMFMSAVGTSMVVQSLMDYFAPERFKASRWYLKSSPGYARSIGGCALLGIGMALAGTGPTIVPSQAAAGTTDAFIIIGGALVGAAVFGIVEPSFFKLDVSCAAGAKITLDQMYNKNYRDIAMPLGIVFLAACVGMEYMFPFKTDALILGTKVLPLMWPTISGIFIGLNQLSIRFIGGHGQGGSTSVMQVVATASGGTIAGRLKMTSLASMTQFLFVWVGTPIGAYFMSQQYPGIVTDHVFPEWQCFLGGFLSIIGARIAGGCTCGNGVSGTSELNVQAMAATAAIFGFGIMTGIVMQIQGI